MSKHATSHPVLLYTVIQCSPKFLSQAFIRCVLGVASACKEPFEASRGCCEECNSVMNKFCLHSYDMLAHLTLI